MSTIIVIILTITFLIALSALFVAAEFATVSLRRSRLLELAEEGNPFARMFLPVLEDQQVLDDYITTCQLGSSLVLLTQGAYSQQIIAATLISWLVEFPYLSTEVAVLVSIVVVLITVTALQIVLGELISKSITIHHADSVALITTVPIITLQRPLRPLLRFLRWSHALLLRVAGLKPLLNNAHTPKQIEQLITESHEGGFLADEEQRLLRNTFRLRELTARHVMIPRTRIIAAPLETDVFALMELAISCGYSRIPLYQHTIDTIVGFVHVKNLLKLYLEGKQDITEIVREAPYVPETIPVAEVWNILNNSGQYLAIVFDEYGGTAGLITFEDLLEEIFGEFQDEFDDELPLVSADDNGRVYLRSELLVTDINEYLDLKLPEDIADTIGGLVFSLLGRPSQEGDEVAIGTPAVRIQVEAMEGRRIAEVSLQLLGDVDIQFGDWEVGKHV